MISEPYEEQFEIPMRFLPSEFTFSPRFNQIDTCFTQIISALNKCDPEKIYESQAVMNSLSSFQVISIGGLDFGVITRLCDLALGDLSKRN